MPDYDIYILPESELTISGGAVLDGVTQGDGSHLVTDPATTITLNSNSWQAINVTDNDTEFADSQGSNQTSTNTQTIDGQTFVAGTNVEAEYAITVTDGTNSYTLIAFNFSTGSPAFGTVEALAFIGPVGGFPPIGVPLTIVSNQEGPSNTATSHASPPCFLKGTLIRTPFGDRAVDHIAEGDFVDTQDHGAQPVRWIGRGTYPGIGRFAPIRFDTGTIGNTRPLCVSPQHRMLHSSWRANVLFGTPDVLIPAHCFVDGSSVIRAQTGFVTYLHLMFDRHEIIFAEGAATESYFADDPTWSAPTQSAPTQSVLTTATAAELAAMFPDMPSARTPHILAATGLKPFEARVVLA